MQLVKVDVKALEPPEPMTVILTSLAQLTPKQCLFVSHRRQPFPLYGKLQQVGWAYHCEVHSDDNVSLYIYRQNETEDFEYHLQKKSFTA